MDEFLSSCLILNSLIFVNFWFYLFNSSLRTMDVTIPNNYNNNNTSGAEILSLGSYCSIYNNRSCKNISSMQPKSISHCNIKWKSSLSLVAWNGKNPYVRLKMTIPKAQISTGGPL